MTTKKRNKTSNLSNSFSIEKESIEIERRHFLLGAAAACTTCQIKPSYATESQNPRDEAPQVNDRIQFIKGTRKGEFVRPELVKMNAKPIEAFPYNLDTKVLRRGNRLNRLLILRLPMEEMDDYTRARAADGVLAYSALCTHRACTIKAWKEEERNLRCHCHLSEFSALNGGSVKRGPANRQLPILPLKLDDDGFVVASELFTDQPGGENS